MGSDAIGAANIGAEERTLFNSCKAASAASSQKNLSAFFSSLYKGVAFSPRRLINQLTAATQPVNLYTSLRQVGLLMSSIALIFSGFTSMPLCEIMKPRSFPAGTPKTHFSGFNIILYFRRLSKVSLRLLIRLEPFLVM